MIDLITGDRLSKEVPEIATNKCLTKRVEVIKKLTLEILPKVHHTQRVMHRMTTFRQEEQISGETYDGLLEFWFSFKQSTLQSTLEKVCSFFNAQYRAKTIDLSTYTEEMLSFALLLSFAEFWDFSSFLYQSFGDEKTSAGQKRA